MQSEDAPEAEPDPQVYFEDRDSDDDDHSSKGDDDWTPSDEEQVATKAGPGVVDLTECSDEDEDEVQITETRPGPQPGGQHTAVTQQRTAATQQRTTATQQHTTAPQYGPARPEPDMSRAGLLEEAERYSQEYQGVRCVTRLERMRTERRFTADQHRWQYAPPARIDEQREGLPEALGDFDSETASLEDFTAIVRAEQRKLRALGPAGEQLAAHLDRIVDMA